MKQTIIKSVLALILITGIGINLQAQKKFRGVINFSMSYGGTIDAAAAAQQPKSVIVTVYDNLTKSTINFGPVQIDQITDGNAKTNTVLLDMMGEKKYFTQTTAEIEEKAKDKPKPEIKLLDETKVIAGYTCKKAEITLKNEDDEATTIVVYYTDELGGEELNYGSQFQGIKGMPMEYVITSSEGGIVTTTATEVKKTKVKETDFLIPSDYVELTKEEKEEMLKMFQE